VVAPATCVGIEPTPGSPLEAPARATRVLLQLSSRGFRHPPRLTGELNPASLSLEGRAADPLREARRSAAR
jgi:hypothetical protein